MANSQEKEIAATARHLFNHTKYEDSLLTIQKLKLLDPKVLHNIAVATYYLHGGTDPKKLQDDLNRIKKRFEDKVAEQEVEESQILYDESDSAIIQFNQAVINYQMRQFATSLTILETLFQNIEPIEEFLAIKICFLLAELYMLLKNKDKVSLMIAYLEKSFPQLTKDSDKGNKETEEMKEDSQSYFLDITSSEFKYNLHMLKAKLHLMNKSMKASKREIKIALSTHHQNLTNNILLMSTYVKAQLEYQQGNYNKSIKLLNSYQKSNDKYVAVLYFNNLGCIHYKMKKYNAASFYFTRALTENELMIEISDPKSLPAFFRNKRLHLMYNIGTKLLFTGNPELAFKCFQESSLLVYKQPKTWLRLAECCIAAHVKKIQENKKNGKNGLIRKVTGNDQMRRVLLPVNDTAVNKGLTLEDQEIIDETSGVQYGSISLEYGAKAVRNALFLLGREGSINPAPVNNVAPASNPGTNIAAPGAVNNNALPSDEENMKQVVLAAGAFIALASHNPVVALSYAKELLNVKKCTEIYRFYANIYAAEAYCLLNRPADAVHHLSPTALGMTDANLPSYPYASPPEPVTNIRYALCVNLAVVHILKDDLAQAQQFVNHALSISKSSAAILLHVYLELRRGNTETALMLLKVNSGLGFTPPKTE